jgi:hypothetical protein
MEYGNRRLFPLLALLYPGVDVRNEFHVDHVFPKSKLTQRQLHKAGLSDEAVADAQWYVNVVANLQLLEGPFNEAKRAQLPTAWARERFGADSNELRHYLAVNDLDGLPATQAEFADFASRRRKKIARRLTELLAGTDKQPPVAATEPETVFAG